jgi:simple sugar transport system ATP-binding protein
MSLADRIAVMHKGRIVGIFRNTPELSEQELGLYMLGVQEQSAGDMAEMM